jgi:hypothetical protein
MDWMAVAIGSEHGLFIAGEAAEAASGELRAVLEPATGNVLARAALAGEADVEGMIMDLGAQMIPLKHEGVIYLRPPLS